jgi:hypothetical protein
VHMTDSCFQCSSRRSGGCVGGLGCKAGYEEDAVHGAVVTPNTIFANSFLRISWFRDGENEDQEGPNRPLRFPGSLAPNVPVRPSTHTIHAICHCEQHSYNQRKSINTMNIRVSYQYSRSAKSAAIPSPTYGPERTRTPALGGALALGTLGDDTEDV